MNNNIIFYLTFKKDLVFFYENLPLREALELMYKHGYTAIPVIGLDGTYVGTVSEGDFLWFILQKGADAKTLESYTVTDLIRDDFMPPVNISVSIDDILETALHQNFVPVVDDRSIFIGIITRQTLLRALGSSSLQPSFAAMPNSENASTRI